MNKNIIKKITVLLLVLVMAFGAVSTVLAYPACCDNPSPGKVTYLVSEDYVQTQNPVTGEIENTVVRVYGKTRGCTNCGSEW